MPHHDPSNTTWAVPPVNLALAENTVDVWLISLTQPGDSYASLTGLVSSAERERAARFKFDVHRRRFVIAHAALRSILLQYLKTAPTDLRFVESVNGKPRLAAELAGSGVQFNLSHSYEVALLGVTRGRE
ncbi:MAG TPA: 4'-phosphopantetheinyl transferase, partial [Candidatus Binatia bacterium]